MLRIKRRGLGKVAETPGVVGYTAPGTNSKRIEMKVYAVRQKSTGLFIPRLETGKRRGGSWLEPSSEREPRFFHNRRAALSFLGNWLQGIFKNEHHEYPLEGYVEAYAVPVKQPHRKKEDMEIVEFDCIEVRPNLQK